MKKIPILILIIFAFIACNKTKVVVVEKFDSGEPKLVKEYSGRDTLNYLETKYYENNAKMIEGRCVGGEREGRWQAWYEDGTLWSEGDFKAGKNHGQHSVYYENGIMRFSGEYIDGARIGAWQFYDTLGTIIKTVEY